MCFSRHKTRQPNQQGPDRGSSYRSIAFIKCSREENYWRFKELTANKVFANPIVTEVKPVTDFMRIIIKIMWNTIPISLMWKAFRYRDTTSLKKHIKKLKPIIKIMKRYLQLNTARNSIWFYGLYESR
jgi:hypothetical protein